MYPREMCTVSSLSGRHEACGWLESVGVLCFFHVEVQVKIYVVLILCVVSRLPKAAFSVWMLIDGDDIILGDWLHCGSTLVLRQVITL